MNKIIDSIKLRSQQTPHLIALSKSGQKISYSELVFEIEKLTEFLRQKSFSSVAIFADNSPAWIAFDLACLKAKITITPIPHFFTKDQILNLLQESCVEAVLSDNLLKFPVENLSEEKLEIFSQKFSLLKIDQKNNHKKFPQETLKITFTSGSTGSPKGVCLGLRQIENVVFALAEKLKNENLQSNLSLLPLSVLLENIAGVYCSLILGSNAIIPSLSEVGVGGSSSLNLEKFSTAINLTKPDSLILVPELAKVLIALISAKKITDFNFKFIAVGGAKIAPDLLQKAHELGLPLYQGYGLSEFSSVVALNRKDENKIGAVGKILPHINVKISAKKEVLLKGNLALGYSDGKAMDIDEEGWYQSGDIGHVDEDNFLFIDGRKKNIFITSFGRNVNPEWLESELLKSPLILQAVVFGEAMPCNVAVITAHSGTNLQVIEKEVASANSNLPDYAQIKKIFLSTEPFSAKNNMLTGNGRIRRDEVFKNYQNLINQNL
jgi:long-subunit acyl-CoA synthetase (AMP-forming)